MKANYVIFHPESSRQKILVEARAVKGSDIVENWKGHIWVDSLFNGNEDPFVFSINWLYSYCHATQLRRMPRKNEAYIQVGSKLIFCSGDSANQGTLEVDTVFEVGRIHKWNPNRSLELPPHFIDHFENKNSDLWERHFKFPFLGIHESVKFTYEAQMGKYNSYLPISISNERVKITLDSLPPHLSSEIRSKVKGKYPVFLTSQSASIILALIEEKARIKVLGNIQAHEY